MPHVTFEGSDTWVGETFNDQMSSFNADCNSCLFVGYVDINYGGSSWTQQISSSGHCYNVPDWFNDVLSSAKIYKTDGGVLVCSICPLLTLLLAHRPTRSRPC